MFPQFTSFLTSVVLSYLNFRYCDHVAIRDVLNFSSFFICEFLGFVFDLAGKIFNHKFVEFYDNLFSATKMNTN